MSKTADQTHRLDTNVVTGAAAQTTVTDAAVRPSLLVYHRHGIRVAPLREGVALVIGREPDAADLAIADSSLSRRHAAFIAEAGAVWVEDLGSTNGTRVNGQRIEGKRQIGPGEDVVLGTVAVALHEPRPGALEPIGLDTHEQFRRRLAEETARARAFRRGLALLVVQALDQQAGQIARWSLRATRGLRPFEHAALYSENVVEVLLPEASFEQAERLASSIVEGRPSDEPALRVGIAMMPEAATSAEELLQLALAAARDAGPDTPVQRARVNASRDVPPPDETNATMRSPAMESVHRTVAKLAGSVIPVLIQGETGSGKEVIANAIHAGGSRRDRPLVCVNCGAIPSQLVESTLFGHERGAFTGAAQQAVGVFESARGGSVLLDEIGELPAAAQAALLRVLETKRITRVGSTREIETDVRVLASTHRDLEAMCREGEFRWDLLYRLNAMTLEIPPLRARPEEIAPLTALFAQQAGAANGCSIESVEPAALQLLECYHWPGNVRELRNAIERAVVIAEGDTVTVEDLPERVRALSEVAEAPESASGTLRAQPSAQPAEPSTGALEGSATALDFKSRAQRFECELLLDALRQTDWDRAKAAELLGLPLRTLARRMKSHGIKRVAYGRQDSQS